MNILKALCLTLYKMKHTTQDEVQRNQRTEIKYKLNQCTCIKKEYTHINKTKHIKNMILYK